MPGLRVGLTGVLGSGKSTVLGMFRRLGAVTMDADAVARECLKKGTPSYRRIVRRFGESILGRGGRIERPALARRVFTNAAGRRALEGIVHPAVKRRLERRLSSLPRGRVAVCEVPLLYEAGLERMFDKVVVVSAPERTRRRRLKAGRSLGGAEARRREAAQWPLSRKCGRADAVIENRGNKALTRRHVLALWRAWRAEQIHKEE